MVIEEIIELLPRVTAVVGADWLHGNTSWILEYIAERLPWFKQLDRDLELLNNQVNADKLIACFRSDLRNRPQIQKAIFEIHGAALLFSTATSINLHVPRGDGSGKNFDVQAIIRGRQLNADVKTRKDEFPFKSSPSPEGIYAAARPTVDPHDATDLGIDKSPKSPGVQWLSTPENTVIRQRLCEALSQLPESGFNLVLFGQIEGDIMNLEDALYGAPIYCFPRYRTGEVREGYWTRVPTGAFSPGEQGEPFRYLCGVLWFRLSLSGRSYRLFPNPYASNPLPENILESLTDLLRDHEATDLGG